MSDDFRNEDAVVIALEEIGAGEDEHVLWISLGFKSEISPFDVLFIVSSKFDNPPDGTARALYFERFDQGMSCQAGGDRITLAPAAITILFSPVGQIQLCFPACVRFDCAAVPADQLTAARAILHRMAALPWGAPISFTT